MSAPSYRLPWKTFNRGAGLGLPRSGNEAATRQVTETDKERHAAPGYLVQQPSVGTSILFANVWQSPEDSKMDYAGWPVMVPSVRFLLVLDRPRQNYRRYVADFIPLTYDTPVT